MRHILSLSYLMKYFSLFFCKNNVIASHFLLKGKSTLDRHLSRNQSVFYFCWDVLQCCQFVRERGKRVGGVARGCVSSRTCTSHPNMQEQSTGGVLHPSHLQVAPRPAKLLSPATHAPLSPRHRGRPGSGTSRQVDKMWSFLSRDIAMATGRGPAKGLGGGQALAAGGQGLAWVPVCVEEAAACFVPGE